MVNKGLKFNKALFLGGGTLGGDRLTSHEIFRCQQVGNLLSRVDIFK